MIYANEVNHSDQISKKNISKWKQDERVGVVRLKNKAKLIFVQHRVTEILFAKLRTILKTLRKCRRS